MERLIEIWDSIRTNKLRTFLTGFSVAWGIFMMVLLQGLGNGLQNGTKENFKDDAINSIFVSGGQTSIMYDGMQPGRKIEMNNDDYEMIKNDIGGVEKISARVDKWRAYSISYGNKNAAYRIRGVHPDHQFVEKTIITKGRFINQFDTDNKRKCCVVGEQVVTDLMEDQDPMGKWINIGNTPFRIVGLFKDEGSEGENSMIYIPISTAQLALSRGRTIDRVVFTTGDASLEETQKMAEEVKQKMAIKYHFSPDDPRAMHIRNNYEEFKRINDTLELMKSFFWLIGVLTIFAGIIGVSNIMLITVQERTKEIGIRKAIGATPFSVILMIVQEAILITGIFGYIGLFGGVFILELIAKKVGATGAVIANPTVELKTAIIALTILILAGGLAALFPSLKAARIKPVEALSAE
ncbi:MAG: ABC transporter permease [Flavobacteriales bacterium]|nr:ABC transporter permease [Flavobacteriales bacterium]